MATRVAINGFGRIGRLVLRAIREQGRRDVELVAVNDRSGLEINSFLLQHDSTHGAYPGPVEAGDGALEAGIGTPVRFFHEDDPAKLPWGELDVDVVLECTGKFTKREDAGKHLEAGAKRVLVSAPAKGADLTVVMGVNDDKLTPEHRVISNGSCTTNCLAPVVKVMHDTFGIERGYMTTVHSYTGDQRLVDATHKDKRRARAGASNMIPTTTGAARAVAEVVPELKGKLDGGAIRVPTLNVSLVDFTFDAAKPASVEAVNDALRAAAGSNRLKGILGVAEEPLVSADFNHTAESSIADIPETNVVDDSLVRVVAWYDNEWAFSVRMLDAAATIGKLDA